MVKYSQWVSNIVVVSKKEGKIRVCVDFRNLNKASSKDDFPLPHIDVLVDNAACRYFFGKLTYVLKEEDTNIIRGIPQIYNDNRNIKQQMATG